MKPNPCCELCAFKGGIPRLGIKHCGNFDCICHPLSPVKEEKCNCNACERGMKTGHTVVQKFLKVKPKDFKDMKLEVNVNVEPTEEEWTLSKIPNFQRGGSEVKVSHAKYPHTQEDWEKEFAEIIAGRKNSKYHRNYIAIHVAEAFIRKVREEARNTTLDEVSDIAEEMKFTYGCGGNSTDCGAAIPNQALDDLLQHIKDLRK